MYTCSITCTCTCTHAALHSWDAAIWLNKSNKQSTFTRQLLSGVDAYCLLEDGQEMSYGLISRLIKWA